MKEISTTIKESTEETRVISLQDKLDRYYKYMKSTHGDSKVLQQAAYMFPLIVREHYEKEIRKVFNIKEEGK